MEVEEKEEKKDEKEEKKDEKEEKKEEKPKEEEKEKKEESGGEAEKGARVFDHVAASICEASGDHSLDLRTRASQSR